MSRANGTIEKGDAVVVEKLQTGVVISSDGKVVVWRHDENSEAYTSPRSLVRHLQPGEGRLR